jgi:DNA polymerase V
MIGLMDCNNFFVSCERLFRPDLLKRPVAVLSSNDGCIVARSQEIKDLGIPMGAPYFKVRDICEEAGAVLFSSNFTLYRDISARVMQTLASLVGKCEIYSIDEAFFTVHENTSEAEIAAIRSRIIQNVGLPVSIGVASTKTLAKQASSLAKKGTGVCILTNEKWNELKDTTSCSSIWNLGRKTSAKLREMGVETVSQFLELDPAVIRRHFGVMGERLQKELIGVSVYDVGSTTDDVQQSIMSTRSFEKTSTSLRDLESAVGYHVSFVAQKLREKKLVASRIHVALLTSRHGNFMFQGATGEVELLYPSSDTQVLLHAALEKVRTLFLPSVPYKKAGVVCAGLMPEVYTSGNLFESKTNNPSQIDVVVDSLNEKFGYATVRSAIIGSNPTRTSAKLRSQEYTTRWKDIPSVRAK